MGMTNENRNQQQTVKDPRMEISFNTGSKAPSYCGWRLTEEELCAEFLKIARDQVSEFTEFTIGIDTKTGAINGYVWMEKKSKHLTDSSLVNNPNVALHVEISSVSDDINKFTKRFCRSNERTPYNDKMNRDRCGFLVDITKFIEIFVDKNGEEYQRQYGYRPPQFEIEIEPVFSEKEGRKFGRLDYIDIRKTTRRRRMSRKPVPVRAYNRG